MIDMLSIDEAIAHAREKEKEIRENLINGNNLEPYESYCNAMTERRAKKHEQIAEWLGELKAYKQNTDLCPICDTYCSYLADEFENGYNKAIDDCKEITFREVVYCDSLNDRTEFRELAEQLKAGGENDNLRK